VVLPLTVAICIITRVCVLGHKMREVNKHALSFSFIVLDRVILGDGGYLMLLLERRSVARN
jgi:hypothetical protein